jgi:UDP-glucuronate 4-epimerase
MNTVLVTGGAGFIGSHLCEKLLTLGCKVICIDNFNDFYDPQIKRNNISGALQSSDYSLIEGDIRDWALLETVFKSFKVDCIVHLAALAGVRKSVENPQEYVDVDIKGTVNLLELGRRNNIKKFVFASSSSVYGSNRVPFREEDFTASQTSPYAAAKMSGELFCRTYNHLYGTPVVCLRFFTVYGPRQRPEMAVHYFTQLVCEGAEVPLFGSGTSSRDYTYIDDVVDGIVSSMTLSSSFEIINLGNSNPVRLDYLLDLIERNLGKKAHRKHLPSQPGDMETTCADITKARNLLNYNPRICIEEGIEKFIGWYRTYRPQLF